MSNERITTVEAAELIGCSLSMICRYIKDGYFTTIDYDWSSTVPGPKPRTLELSEVLELKKVFDVRRKGKKNVTAPKAIAKEDLAKLRAIMLGILDKVAELETELQRLESL